MKDNRYIIFEVLIEYDMDGVKEYNAISLSNYMYGKSVEEWLEDTKKYCKDAEIKHTAICKKTNEKYNSKWTLCGHRIIDLNE
jgi:hypothetical protein